MAVSTEQRPIEVPVRTAAYRLVAELLLYPQERDRECIGELLQALSGAPACLREPIDAFLASPRSGDPDEYLILLELTPPCPLYLGAYLFEEPATCRGAGMSGRNAYMLELAAIYRHFGFALGGELADFIPAMAEFLALSLEHRDRDRIGLRRHMLEHYLRPGLAPMRAAMEKYQTPYAFLIQALAAAVDEDIAAGAGQRRWLPPIPIRPVGACPAGDDRIVAARPAGDNRRLAL